MKTTYKLEQQRIWGLTEGEHSAPIVFPTGNQIDTNNVDLVAKSRLYFYRDDEGKPTGPRLFVPIGNGFYVMISQEDVDIL